MWKILDRFPGRYSAWNCTDSELDRNAGWALGTEFGSAVPGTESALVAAAGGSGFGSVAARIQIAPVPAGIETTLAGTLRPETKRH